MQTGGALQHAARGRLREAPQPRPAADADPGCRRGPQGFRGIGFLNFGTLGFRGFGFLNVGVEGF